VVSACVSQQATVDWTNPPSLRFGTLTDTSDSIVRTVEVNPEGEYEWVSYEQKCLPTSRLSLNNSFM
jgi:hypothetical protein